MSLEIQSLRKTFGQKVALCDFSYTFSCGVYGILGVNGAGKTTLLRLLTDAIRRESGSICIDGTEILSMGKQYRAMFGYMPQEQCVYDKMHAMDFLLYIASLKGLPKKSARQQIAQLLSVVGLENEATKKLGDMSGGMLRRVGLAQALLGDPPILFLDEPTTGLDPRERLRIRNYIASISCNKTILLATHLVSDIECIASRVLLMKDGTLIAEGTPEDLIQKVKSKIWECRCDGTVSPQTPFGNIIQRSDGQYLRVVCDAQPPNFLPAQGTANLEDVCLYYFEEPLI